MSCLYLHEILPVSVLTSTFHTSHGLIDSLIRYSVFKVQTTNLFDLLKAFDVGIVSIAYFVTGIRPPLPVMDRFICASTLTVPCHEGHFSLLSWRLRDSNSRPPACKAGALPTELSPLLPLPSVMVSILFISKPFSFSFFLSGSHLLSHIVSNAVPSAA